MAYKKHSAYRGKFRRDTGFTLALPFFITLGVLTVVSFLIPLRPSRSQMEKRNLASFPEFSWSTLADGTYFDGITLWFSDTFPGREGWIALSTEIESLHGYSEISIAGDLPMDLPEEPQATAVLQTEPAADDVPAETEEDGGSETVPEETGWGGVDAGEADVELSSSAIIQIGDSAFNAVGFSQVCSDGYADVINQFADLVAEKGIRVVSAPCPTAVGILIQPEYLEKMHCADQNETIRYLHSKMDDKVVKVDTYGALVPHNSEYIYFRTDHHWTARGAYYSYEAICKALGYDYVPLEELEEWDQGEFEGSLYYKAKRPKQLKKDTLIAYVPKGNIEMRVGAVSGTGTIRPLIQDMTNREVNAKYSAFLFSDNAFSEITNHDLPDGPTCIVFKDSFGNALVPFLAQSYHKIYAIDYRKFHESTIGWFLHEHEVDDVIMAPYVIATQSHDGVKMFGNLCR